MNKNIFTLIVIAFIAAATLTSCKNAAERRADEAKEEPAEVAKKDMETKYAEDQQTFKAASDQKIKENEDRIHELNAKMDKAGAKAKAKYKEQVAALELKNNEMKNKMHEYKYDTKDKWESFKREFNHDMDELGKALKDLTVDNKK